MYPLYLQCIKVGLAISLLFEMMLKEILKVLFSLARPVKDNVNCPLFIIAHCEVAPELRRIAMGLVSGRTLTQFPAQNSLQLMKEEIASYKRVNEYKSVNAYRFVLLQLSSTRE